MTVLYLLTIIPYSTLLSSFQVSAQEMYSNCTNQILLYMKETFIVLVLIKLTSESQVSVYILYRFSWPAVFHSFVVTFCSYFHLLI